MVRAHLIGLSAALLALSGCGGDKAPSPAATSEAAVAGPEAKPGLSASGGRLVLPAVPGNPGAAYLTVANGNTSEATVAAVYVSDAERAEMHETKGGAMAPLRTVPVPAGQSVAFAPGGKHVMVFGIAESVKPGGAAELTLTFADGDKLSVPLTVEAPGVMGAMEGMDHDKAH